VGPAGACTTSGPAAGLLGPSNNHLSGQNFCGASKLCSELDMQYSGTQTAVPFFRKYPPNSMSAGACLATQHSNEKHIVKEVQAKAAQAWIKTKERAACCVRHPSQICSPSCIKLYFQLRA